MAENEKIRLLSLVDIFAALNEDQLSLLADMATEKWYDRDQTIILEEDDTNQSFFIIAEGKVKVYLSGVDGREAILAMMTEGEFFGEMSLLDGDPRSASVKAVDKSRLLMIRREDFIEEIRRFPDLSLAMLTEMSRRLRKTNRQISSLALMSAYGRVAACLLNIMEQQGIRTRMKDGTKITLIRSRPTQQQIAEMSGTTRETVSRVLNSLQKKGYITLQGKELVILQEDELKLEE